MFANPVLGWKALKNISLKGHQINGTPRAPMSLVGPAQNPCCKCRFETQAPCNNSLTLHWPCYLLQIKFRASCACLQGTCCVRTTALEEAWTRQYEVPPAASCLHLLPTLPTEKTAPLSVLVHIWLLKALVPTCPSLYITYDFPIWLTVSILRIESTHFSEMLVSIYQTIWRSHARTV
jgi:hypothetical protein